MSVAGNRGGSGFRLPEEVEVVEVREAADCGAAKKARTAFAIRKTGFGIKI